MQEEKFLSWAKRAGVSSQRVQLWLLPSQRTLLPIGAPFILPVVRVCCRSLVSSHHSFCVFCSVCIVSLSLLSSLPWPATEFCTYQNPASATSIISSGCGSIFFYPSCLVLCPATGFCMHQNRASATSVVSGGCGSLFL